MSKAGKITAAISGAFLLLIVVAIILIATFDWNRLKPTINQKVSAELNCPFAIRGNLGVVWERQKQETGWRSWVPWPHVHAEDIILGNHGYSRSHDGAFATRRGNAGPAGAADQNGLAAVDQARKAQRAPDSPL